MVLLRLISWVIFVQVLVITLMIQYCLYSIMFMNFRLTENSAVVEDLQEEGCPEGAGNLTEVNHWTIHTEVSKRGPLLSNRVKL